MKKYTFKDYIEYIKDNPKGYWFKRKLYGWGWVPVTREGWIVTILFIGIILLNGFYLASNPNPSDTQITIFLVIVFVSIILLILIAYRTGEKPCWRWGR